MYCTCLAGSAYIFIEHLTCTAAMSNDPVCDVRNNLKLLRKFLKKLFKKLLNRSSSIVMFSYIVSSIHSELSYNHVCVKSPLV